MNVDRPIQQACRFLETMQWPAGYWLDFQLPVGMSSQWVTAYTAHCLAEAAPRSPALPRARQWLLESELTEGGWGYNRDIPPDADSTANVLFFLERFAPEQTDPTIRLKIAQTLLAYQSSGDGGFATYLPRVGRAGKADSLQIYPGSGWCLSHVSVTALAALALAPVDPAAFDTNLQAAAAFLRKNQRPEGCWDDHWWNERFYATYWASRFLLWMGDPQPAQRAAGWVLNTAQAGAWGSRADAPASAFHTALALLTLLLAEPWQGSRQAVELGAAWLVENQRADGSWESVPMLLTPSPEILDPTKSLHPSAHLAIADQNRQFTTATVLLALAQIRALGPAPNA